MRTITIILLVLLLLLQYPLWLGKGGWLKVWEMHQQVQAQLLTNQQSEARNAVLDAEVRDLKQGTEAIEERARGQLGLVKKNEVLYQLVESASSTLPASPVSVSQASTVSASAK